jgi:hypothetical protein
MAGTRVTVAQVGTTSAVSGTRAFTFGICDLAPRQLRAIVASEPATRSAATSQSMQDHIVQ